MWKPDAYEPEAEVQKDAAWVEGKTADELEELEDEFGDDRALEEFRRAALAQDPLGGAVRRWLRLPACMFRGCATAASSPARQRCAPLHCARDAVSAVPTCTCTCTAAHCRRKRIAELRAGAARPRFGGLEEIRGSEFVAQITNAGEGVWAVCHLYKDRCAPCCAVLCCAAAGRACCSLELAPAGWPAAVLGLRVCTPQGQLAFGADRPRLWSGTPTPAPAPRPPASRPPLPGAWRSVQDCAILNQCLAEVAKSYPATKFVKIVSTGARVCLSLRGAGLAPLAPPLAGAAALARARGLARSRAYLTCPTPCRLPHHHPQSASQTTQMRTCPRCWCTVTQSA